MGCDRRITGGSEITGRQGWLLTYMVACTTYTSTLPQFPGPHKKGLAVYLQVATESVRILVSCLAPSHCSGNASQSLNTPLPRESL